MAKCWQLLSIHEYGRAADGLLCRSLLEAAADITTANRTFTYTQEEHAACQDLAFCEDARRVPSHEQTTILPGTD